MTKASGTFTIHIDGAARGNPGPAAYGIVIQADGQPPLEESACLGDTTNNFAEYTALVRALERSQTMGARRLRIRSDSELLVKQMNGIYRVKNAQLKPLYEQAKELIDEFDDVQIEHVRREYNREADRLCNEALDGRPVSLASRPPVLARPKTPREEAIACLADALKRASEGAAPKPEALWDQLCKIQERKRSLSDEEE